MWPRVSIYDRGFGGAIARERERELRRERKRAAILFPVSREHFRSPSRSPAPRSALEPLRSPSAIIFKLNAPVRPVIYCRQFSYNPPGGGSPYLPPLTAGRSAHPRQEPCELSRFVWSACRNGVNDSHPAVQILDKNHGYHART